MQKLIVCLLGKSTQALRDCLQQRLFVQPDICPLVEFASFTGDSPKGLKADIFIAQYGDTGAITMLHQLLVQEKVGYVCNPNLVSDKNDKGFSPPAVVSKFEDLIRIRLANERYAAKTKT